MASVNKVIIVGNLGADPDVKIFDNGGKIANVSIATSEKWTDKQTGEPKEHTEWHRVVFNDRLADIVAQYLRKGSQIYVEGSLRTRKWQDPQTGQDRYSTEIRAMSMQMLGGRPSGQSDYNTPTTHNQSFNKTYTNQQDYHQQGYGQQAPHPNNHYADARTNQFTNRQSPMHQQSGVMPNQNGQHEWSEHQENYGSSNYSDSGTKQNHNAANPLTPSANIDDGDIPF